MQDKGSKRKAVEGLGSSSMAVPGRGKGPADKQCPKQCEAQPQLQPQKQPKEAQGRKQHSWPHTYSTRRNEGDEAEDSGDGSNVQCNHCGKKMIGNITCMKNHLLNLPASSFLWSEEAKKLARKYAEVRSSSRMRSSHPATEGQSRPLQAGKLQGELAFLF